MDNNIVVLKWTTTEIVQKIISEASEKKIKYILFNNIKWEDTVCIALKLRKNDPIFKKFNIIPSKFKTRTYYLTNDDMLIYKLKKEEDPFISNSIIHNYNNFKYVISFFSRLPLIIHTLCIKDIFKKENYIFNSSNYIQHLLTENTFINKNKSVDEQNNNSNKIDMSFNNNECDDLIKEGNFLINYLNL